MKMRPGALPVLLAIGLYGCSSVPSLSMPSLPWSTAKADPTAEALLEEGNRHFNDKRYVRAIDSYSKIKTDHPFSPVVTQVELKIADAYYRNQQYPEAINAFKEFQAMHPTSEHIPLVVLRLGQSYFDQFSGVDRDQKNTEIAKGYFETVITQHPKSAEAAEARKNLAKCLEYLAEHEFNIAHFYFREQKYPAARDRFEEIVRKYKDTPTAVKSLFYLGESYRNEKNAVKATLAYEALIQHYPESKFAAEAKTQLARVEKEKHDPLALLLMRDRRPSVAAAPEVKPDPSLAKLRDLNLVAKTEVVHENPGDEKGFFRRVASKLNPFSSSDDNKKEPSKSETAAEVLAKRNSTKKEESGGLSSFWPFGSKDSKPVPASGVSNNSALVNNIDESLKQKGIDGAARQAALNPPSADLPKTDDLTKGPPTETDTAALLSGIDSKLAKSGKSVGELPPPPEAAEAFKDPAATQTRVAKPVQNEPQPSQSIQSSGILSAIDQKLQARGVEPAQFEKPPTADEAKAAASQKPKPTSVEIEPRLTLERGPLYLSPAEIPAQEKPAANTEARKQDPADRASSPTSRVLVKGPVEPGAAAAKSGETRKPSYLQEEQPKGVLDQIRQDIEGAGKVLNPFSW